MSDEAERYLARVETLRRRDPALTPIQAGLIAAAELGIAHDSRSFAKTLDLEHALVLREMSGLAEAGKLVIVKRDARTLRTHYALPNKS